jgi:hypothetical protein
VKNTAQRIGGEDHCTKSKGKNAAQKIRDEEHYTNKG